MVGRLAASIAHEIGAPLNVIDGRAEQLITQPQATLERRQRNLTIIRAQTKRIERIVRQLLTFVRPFEENRKMIELQPLIAEVIELVGPDAAAAKVRFDTSELKNFPVFADSELIRQVFLNLSVNAIQAMPQGGTLRISSDPAPISRNGNTFASVQFADTGAGIPAEQINYIFEPFFTTKRVSEGTGLGLAICQRIVEKHGGWIYATNAKAGGAVLTICLPLNEAGDETAAPEAASVTTEL
jgi:two-component system, NtrC family, sensor kinase